MSSRLRSLDSKISFFAFADIITAVSGVLIFIALLLATDLGRPNESRSRAANSHSEQQLQEILRQQVDADAQNRRLQDLLAAAETAPATEKLETDISRLRSQLSEEQKKRNALASQAAANQSAIEARDKTLGLTDLKAKIQRTLEETESIARNETKARNEMAALEQQVDYAQSKVLKLRQREGQLWLIPDKSTTTKEPIVVTVAGSGSTVERFDRPDERRQMDSTKADLEFESYLGKANALDQYFVFEIKPSGITLFQDLIKSARDKGFEVGFDAVAENFEVHFSSMPPADEPVPPKDTTTPSTNQSLPSTATSASESSASRASNSPVAAPRPSTVPPPARSNGPPPAKSWWRKLLDFVGLG